MIKPPNLKVVESLLCPVQVLRTLYASVFCVGMSSAVGDAVTHLLRVPSPARLNTQVG